MHKTLLLTIALLLSCLSAISQVTGKVVDENGQAMPFCQVVLAKANDSTMVAMAVTDETGKLSIKNNEKGSFLIMVACIGYKKYCSQPIVISDAAVPYKAGDIKLDAEAKNLKGVDVVAQKPFVEYQPDKTVYNIENSVISVGSNVFEVLKRLPGAGINSNGDISVNGQQGVLVTIDGRNTYMSAADLANYLKSLNASPLLSSTWTYTT